MYVSRRIYEFRVVLIIDPGTSAYTEQLIHSEELELYVSCTSDGRAYAVREITKLEVGLSRS
jgi:hypothetical protein